MFFFFGRVLTVKEIFCVLLLLYSWRIYDLKHGRYLLKKIGHHKMVIEEKIFIQNVMDYYQYVLLSNQRLTIMFLVMFPHIPLHC